MGKTARKSSLKQSSNAQQQVTTFSDVPLYLLQPHFRDFFDHHRKALMQTSQALRDAALSSADVVNFSIEFDRSGQIVEDGKQGPATAAWAVKLNPLFILMLHSNGIPGKYMPAVAAAVSSGILPQTGQVLTSLRLQVGSGTSVQIAACCYVRSCQTSCIHIPYLHKILCSLDHVMAQLGCKPHSKHLITLDVSS